MIVCIGEILVDLIGAIDGNGKAYKRFAGGAPFNVACAANNMGARTGFVGCVGDDIFGKFLYDAAHNRKFDYTDVKIDANRNTALAVVEIDGTGERSFSFLRKNSADCYITEAQAERAVKAADTVCLGTLMLSDPYGYRLAEYVVDSAKRYKKRLCIDVNYRADVYAGRNPAPIYKKFIDSADVVKLSEEEAEMFARGSSPTERITGFGRDKLVCVTLGKAGCTYAFNGNVRRVNSIAVTPVDTTGAGDAFFGCLLAQIDGKDLNGMSDTEIDRVFFRANVCGALTTTARGAIDALPNKTEVFSE